MVLTEKEEKICKKLLFEKHGVLVNEISVIHNIDAFITLEARLNIKRLVMRAVASSDPADKGSLEPLYEASGAQGSQPYTFYWVCLRGEKDEPFVVNYTPRLNYSPSTFPNLRTHQDVKDNVEVTRQSYIDLKDEINIDFFVGKNYKVHDPDKPLTHKSYEVYKTFCDNITPGMHNFPTLKNRLRVLVERYIQERLDEHCEKYHTTKNQYYLERAWFWKDLKYDEMSYFHRMLIGAFSESWMNPALIEYELRNAYRKWPYY